jgi:hypothetical protein
MRGMMGDLICTQLLTLSRERLGARESKTVRGTALALFRCRIAAPQIQKPSRRQNVEAEGGGGKATGGSTGKSGENDKSM